MSERSTDVASGPRAYGTQGGVHGLDAGRRRAGLFAACARDHAHDYEAIRPDREDARRYVEGAAEFLAAIERMLDVSTEPA